jgi:hypothetical protein
VRSKLGWLALAVPIVMLMGITPAEANGFDIGDWVCRQWPWLDFCKPSGGGGDPVSVPEPSTLALLALGAGVWGGMKVLRKKK